ncbi:MAG: branched-chain amino acid transferase [Rhodospirillaceae bacterium]|nr:branched-chain amino acid transferase [Rhodospirillaceae bacterium]MBT3494740.1 branched-chain amino acid transferase [Rhodospirillaceae bacterium]MBT3779095.1 branched-chain amino acid transferase [Rhodospirillaceae bacterium]MBT3976600.1 branched-chain amino acid transferase [Rhodospirillaceae bacterium]MBT4166533.1 branched-chain amino acid transferase [Rhodospirillaceae bacterium]
MSQAETVSKTDNPFADGAAFIAGDYVPIDEARIPITDWGFLHSDVTYDVVAVWGGGFFRLQDHLDRFFRGIEKLHMQSPYDRVEMAAILAECVSRSGIREAYVKLILTRGTPPKGQRDPRTCENQFYAFAIPYVWITPPEKQELGMHLTVSSIPRISPDSVDPTVKNFHWGDMVQGLFEAYDRGAETPVLTDGQGNITEGPGFNIFAAIGGRLVTPDSGVLLGITRKTVIELAQSLNVKVDVGILTEAELRAADEIFISSTAGGVIPVSKLDGKPIGDGSPGPLALRLRQMYWDAHDDGKYVTRIDYH